MPYVAKHRRSKAKADPETTGDLTFAIQQILKKYLDRKSLFFKDRTLTFADYAECLAALEAAKFDLFDRQLRKYEKAKRLENGDVW